MLPPIELTTKLFVALGFRSKSPITSITSLVRVPNSNALTTPPFWVRPPEKVRIPTAPAPAGRMVAPLFATKLPLTVPEPCKVLPVTRAYGAAAETSHVAPLATEICGVFAIELPLPIAKVPSEIVRMPLNVFTPFKVKVPPPLLVKAPTPVRLPLCVMLKGLFAKSAALIVAVVPLRAMLALMAKSAWAPKVPPL